MINYNFKDAKQLKINNHLLYNFVLIYKMLLQGVNDQRIQ